jgi:hypothetical protein
VGEVAGGKERWKRKGKNGKLGEGKGRVRRLSVVVERLSAPCFVDLRKRSDESTTNERFPPFVHDRHLQLLTDAALRYPV